MKKFDKRPDRNQNFVRVNFNIRFSPVRVVRDGEQLGIMPTDDARKLAFDAGLDLVEIAPQARPPVCSIMDYSKYKYEQALKEKERKQKSKSIEIKEIRLRPKIAEHDIVVKAKSAEKFLEQGKKVQFNLMYKNRELAHKDEGFRVMKHIIEILAETGQVELAPRLDGNRLICRLEPKK